MDRLAWLEEQVISLTQRVFVLEKENARLLAAAMTKKAATKETTIEAGSPLELWMNKRM